MTAAAWDLTAPIRIVFGAGRISELGRHGQGRRVLLVTSAGAARRGLTARIAAMLGPRLAATMDQVDPNPDLDVLDRTAASLRGAEPDAVIGLGGGSALDTAKILSVLLAAPAAQSLDGHFRAGLPLAVKNPLPVIAVPTTAGTGAEATPFATLWDHKARRKFSLSGPNLFPKVALLDPELTLSLPDAVTVATALDAISQCIESIWNRNSNSVSEAWARQGLRLGLASLAPVLQSPSDLGLRGRLMEASLLSGLAISHTRTAIAHSISYPITAHFGVPHGIACSFTLPAILEFNAGVDDGRLVGMAHALGCADITAFRDRLVALLHRTGAVDQLRACAATPAKMEAIAHEMIVPGRAENTMREFDSADVTAILQRTAELLQL